MTFTSYLSELEEPSFDVLKKDTIAKTLWLLKQVNNPKLHDYIVGIAKPSWYKGDMKEFILNSEKQEILVKMLNEFMTYVKSITDINKLKEAHTEVAYIHKGKIW